MNETNVKCAHACRNTCAMLAEALREESEMVCFYERLQQECNYPDVHDMLLQLIESRSRSALMINQKLNELSARQRSWMASSQVTSEPRCLSALMGSDRHVSGEACRSGDRSSILSIYFIRQEEMKKSEYRAVET